MRSVALHVQSSPKHEGQIAYAMIIKMNMWPVKKQRESRKISRTDHLCYDNENIARWIEEGDGGGMSVTSHFEFLGNDVHVILSVQYFCLVRRAC